MKLPSGIYYVDVRAMFPDYQIATELIWFHIGPPNSSDFILVMFSPWKTLASATGVILMTQTRE